MTPEPAGLVASGYDALRSEYLRWAAQIEGDPRLEWLAELTGQPSEGARILELGCGAGVPCTQLLAERFSVTGVGPVGRAAPPRPGAAPRRRASSAPT